MAKVYTLQVSDAKSDEEFRLESRQPDLYVGDSSLDHISAPVACSASSASSGSGGSAIATTLRDLVRLLCRGPVRKRRRREGDWDIDRHLWELRVVPPGEPMEVDTFELLNSFGDDDDEDDAMKCREVCVGPERNVQEEAYASEMGLTFVDPDDTLDSLSCLEVGSVLRLRYDFNRTTTIFLRCVMAETIVSESISDPPPKLGYITVQQQQQQQPSVPLPTLESVPAHSYPADKRLDSFYPTLSARFLASTSTFGLSSRITRYEDSTFCSIEPPSRDGGDDIFVPLPFEDINDLLVVSNYCLGRIGRQYDFAMIFPPTEEGARNAREATELYRSDPGAAMFSGPRAFLSKSREEIDRLKNRGGINGGENIGNGEEQQRQQQQHFDFAEAFPKTHAQLTSGRFRWLRWVPGHRMRDAGTLKVVVGRYKGDRRAPPSQVTRTWKICFNDLHELFCAVEASWLFPAGTEHAGEELGDAFLPDHDADLGPSKPLPPDPPVIATNDDAVTVLPPTNTAPEIQITALAIAEVGSKALLFAGDSDGVVKIFDLESNEPEEMDYFDLSSSNAEYGVRGLQVYSNSEEEGICTAYAWMYPNAKYEERNEEDDEDADDGINPFTTLRSFDVSMKDGSLNLSVGITERPCEGLEDLKGFFYDILIAALVIAPARIAGKWQDTIFIGIEGVPDEAPEFATDFSDYNLKDIQENEPSGNILPMIEGSGDCMETWRGHEGCVRALAAVPKKFLVSLGVAAGMEWPGQLILWSLSEFGTPLHRIDLYLNDRSIRAFPPITGMPGGLCIHEEKLVLWGNYGDTLVPIDIEEDSTLKMKGCLRLGQHSDGADKYQGYMASPPNCPNGAISHAGEKRAWIFDISKVGSDPALDKDLSNKGRENCDGDEWGDIVLGARGIAVAQVEIPEKKGPNDDENRRERFCDESGAKVIAMNGPWLVTGQGNGALVKTKLPKDLNGQCGKTSGLLNSSSWSMPQD